MGCATSFVKLIVFIFNFIFALGGLAILVIGVLVLKDVKETDEFLSGKYQAPPILLIVVGSIIFVVSFFGFCGALRENHCMICTYVVLLLTLFVAQAVIGGLAFAYRDDTEDILLDRLNKYVHDYDKHRDVVDAIQKNHKCCGAKGPTNYSLFSALPSSCCVKEGSCYLAELTTFYTTGCEEALKYFIEHQGIIIGGVAIGVASIEILGIIFGLCLANSIKNAERRGRV